MDELDVQRVSEIVTDVFQRKGLAPPYTIEFRLKQSEESKPRAYFEGDRLHLEASTEPELRRLIGRFVIERSWSPHEWLVTNHVGLYGLISSIMLTTLPVIGFQLSWVILEFRLWILVFTITILSVFAFCTGYQVSIRSPKLLNKLTMEMVDLGCMTEYDFKDYTPDYHKVAIGGTITCIWGGLVIGSYGMFYYLEVSLLFIAPVILLLLAGVYFLFAASWKSIGLNLCYENEEYDEEDWEAEFEDNEFLQTEFTDLLDRLELHSILQSKHESEYSNIRARFAETKYAQCRGVYDYVEDDTLYIDCHDITEAAAFRYGTALLVKSSLRFYREVSFSRRAVHLWLIFIGLTTLMVGLLGAFIVSKEFGIGVLVVSGILSIKPWHMGWKQNEEVRRDLPIALRKTGVFKEYEFEFYNEFMFSSSSRFDWGFLLGYELLMLGMVLLILWLV